MTRKGYASVRCAGVARRNKDGPVLPPARVAQRFMWMEIASFPPVHGDVVQLRGAHARLVDLPFREAGEGASRAVSQATCQAFA